MTVYDIAQEIAENHGFVTIPLRGKRPILKNWTQLEAVEEEEWEGADSVGIRTGRVSDICVVDIDNMNVLAEIEHLPDTLTFNTTRGRHFYYRYDSRVPSFSPLDGIDILSDGKQAQWKGTPINDAEIAPFPYEIFSRYTRSKAQGEPYEIPERIISGGRNTGLTRLAGKLINHHTPDETALLVAAYNKACVQPPLSDREMRQVLRSAMGWYNPPTSELWTPQPIETVDGTPPEFVVGEWLAPGHATMVYGDGGAGKTYWIAGLIRAMQRGDWFMDWKTRQGAWSTIVWDSEQSPYQIAKRWEGVRGTVVSGYDLDVPLCITGDKERTRQFFRLCEPHEIIVLDHKSDLFGVENENEQTAWEDCILTIKKLRALGKIVFLVHHASKQGQSKNFTFRGASIIRGAVDNVIGIKLPDQEQALNGETARKLIFDKTKDGFAQSVKMRLEEGRWRVESL